MRAKVTILEKNFVVEYVFEITARGSPGCPPSLNYPGDPPEGAEFEIEVVALYDGDKELDVPQWLMTIIEEHLSERDDINEVVQQSEYEQDYGDY
jgi:hypothetical protein